ncbi:TonB-dependent receptor [Flavobacterium zepuense]|uniref:TonB-dependent receptor n=1 Tax=Flavobacterium zepuense TaxID=2593302 RepID=A0A552V4H4_9FLAO|nr:TonB-dependent receptor [Flavobacterium zepuense]TRW25342.1 TonB-dependent receptor [Flavobacterium zepuense]
MKTKDYLKAFLDIKGDFLFKLSDMLKLKKLALMYLILSSCMINTLSAAEKFQQDPVIVTGKVVDSDNLPVPGVSIYEKGTNTGTQTDIDGNFTIAASSKTAVLSFTYQGFKTVENQIGDNIVMNVQLLSDEISLDEVVVVGYGTQKKLSVVGAQSTLNVDELKQPVASVSTMLAGRISGLTGVQRSGLPGGNSADLWIRGISTFGSSSPLILVDGVERTIDDLNPLDIASFSILKDASATAVYGIRGANGVILIETRKGKIGKPQIMIDYNEGVTSFTKVPDLVDGVTYMRLANEALTTRGQQAKYSEETIQRTASKYDPLRYPDVDWLDAVYDKFARNRQATVNVSGGSEAAKYYVSLGYYDEKGLFKTSDTEKYDSDTRYKRYNFTSNLNIDVTKTTSMTLGVRGYLSDATYPEVGSDGVYGAALEASPVDYPVLYPGGFIPGLGPTSVFNPYAQVALRGYKVNTKNQINSNLRVTQNLDVFTQGLSWTGMFSFDAYNEQNVNRGKRPSTYIVDQNNPYSQDGELILNETYAGTDYLGYSRSNGGNRRVYLETSFNYNRTFDKHAVGGLLLFNRTDYVDAFANDFTASIPYRNQGLAGRVTYGYNDRYFVEVNAGYNGSENFAPNNRYGFFPSFAGGWLISNESFFAPLKGTIDYLKIRYSDGKVGAASGAGRFAYLSRVEDNQPGFDFGEDPQYTPGIRETYYGSNVTWSTSRKQDLGIEVNAFDNSLKIIFDLFKERTSGAFLSKGDVPIYIGLAAAPFGNVGVTENKGFDGSVNYTKDINNLKLSLRGTFTYNKNKIIENGAPLQLYDLDRRGTPINSRFGYVAERLYTLADDVNKDGFISPADGSQYPTQFGQIMPGDIKYTDLTGDGKIDSYDQKQIGVGDVPAFTYGFGLTAEYKHFDLSLFFQGQSDADIMLSGQSVHPFVGGGGIGNLYTAAIDRWTPESDNPNAMYPRLSYGDSGIGQNNNTQVSSWWLRSVNFLRLKTAEIGYSLPTEFSNRLKIQNVRFYARGVNLLTFSKFDMWDPELNSGNGRAYPNITTISVGLNIQY